jgi:outer membrane receptor for ferrienterochelin and colicins
MNIIAARGLLLAGVSALALTAAVTPVHAQSVDYGALEQLYGEPVTTSATGKPQKVSEVPANMEIITQDDIRRSGADNIPDILQFVTGISVRRNAFADAAVAVRGYAQAINPRLLVLLNGRQVYVDDYGYVPWQTIPVALDEIRQIEIVKGPNSALFGFNAVAGVINIITHDPLYDSFSAFTGRYGTQDLREGSVVGTFHEGENAGVKVTAGGYLAHEFSDPYASPKPLNPTQGYINADGKYRVAPGVIVSLSASSVTANNIADSSIGSLLQRYYRTNSVSAGISADSPIGALSLMAYRNELNFDSTAGTGSTNFWTNVVYVVQGNDVLRLNADHTIRIGLEYRDNALEAPIFVANGIGYKVWSGSGMWDWQIIPQVSLTNAVRFDHLALDRSGTAVTGDGFPNTAFNSRTIDEVSFNSGVVYRPTDVDTVRLTAGRGVQVPSLLQFGVNTGANPNLDPTIVMNYEADYDRALPSLGSVVRTALFYQTNTDLLAIGNAAPTVKAPNGKLTRISNNIGSSDELGLEIGIKGHTESGLRWNASYTFSNVTENVTSNRLAAPDTPFDYMHGTPVHTVDVGIGYSIGKWEFDTQGKWQSEFRDYISINNVLQQPKLISDYITATARIGYHLTDKVTLALAADQFNQENVATTAAIPVQRRIIASVTAKF